MKRIAVILIFAAWLTAVSWHWWMSVPLAATSSARRPPDTQVRSLSPSGQLPLVHSRFTNGPGSPFISCGPLEFWAFPECRKVRELFDKDDEIIDGPLFRTREVLIRRNGRLIVVNSESDETIGDLPDVPGARRFAVVPGNRQVLIDDNRDIHLYEFGQETPRWTASLLRLRGPVEGEPIAAGVVTVASKRSQKSPGSIAGTVLLRLDTGELDPRFDHLGRISRIRLAPNGRFALVTLSASPATRTPGRTVLCDASSGEVLWTFPGVTDYFNHPLFDADGEEVLGFEMTPEKRLIPARWRSVDGSPLPSPRPPDLMRVRHQSADGQFTVRHPVINGSSLVNRTVASINNLVSRCRLGFQILNFRDGPALLEMETGQGVGPLPDHRAETHYMFLRDRPALVCATLGEIVYYDLPTQRNYWWLAGWALLPPFFLIALLKGWDRWRLRRTTREVDRTPGELIPNAQSSQ